MKCASAIIAFLLMLAGRDLPAQTSCVPPPTGLVSWWQAEDNALDMIGGNNGTIHGAVSFVAGTVGRAFSFDGASGYVEVPDDASLRVTNQVTIEFWVKRLRVDGHYEYLVEKGGDWLVGQQQNYALQIHGPDNGLCLTWAGGYRIAGAITNLDWHHCAVVATNGQADPVFYIDGALQPITQSNGGAIGFRASTLPLHIGAQIDPVTGINYYGNAVIDELSIYDRALSSNEIVSIYEAGAAGKCIKPSPPSIITQPSSANASVGDVVNFTVLAAGSPPLSYQWQKDGGALGGAMSSALTITNVQSTDAGTYFVVVSNALGMATSSNAVLSVSAPGPCVTPAPGLVSWWRGEGDATDSAAGLHNGTLKSAVTFAQGKVGRALHFDGTTNSYVEVADDPALRLTNSLTIEFWVKRLRVDGHYEYLVEKGGDWTAGQQNYALQFHGPDNGLCLTWAGGFRIAGVINDLNWHHCAVVVTNGQADPVFYIDGASQKITQSTGGAIQLPPSTRPLHIGAQIDPATGLNYYGNTVIDELSIYDRALSSNEVFAIYQAGAGGKCLGPIGPSLESQPQSQSVMARQSASFGVLAAGTEPLSYQWQFDGAPIAGATSNVLVLNSVLTSSAGSYSVVVSNSVGSITSSPAILTVILPPSAVQVGSATVGLDGTVRVPVNLLANGIENAVSFTLDFDSTLLSNPAVELGGGALGTGLVLNQSQAATGKVGVAIAMPAGLAFLAGTQQLIVVSFTSQVITKDVSTTIGFDSSPVTNLVVDSAGQYLNATFDSGTVVLPASQLEGDSYPRPDGDGLLNVSDWVLVGRLVAGLDSPTNALEFQKADCAPRDTLGDGRLTVSDWVQAGRYAAGLDPATRVGGPSAPVPNVVAGGTGPAIARRTGSISRQVRASQPVPVVGDTGTVEVDLEAQGNENALAFSLSFDPSQLVFARATAGAAANGAVLNINANQAALGRVGFGLALEANQTFPAGSKQMVRVSFRPAPSAAGTASVSFGDQPVIREVSDAGAATLPADYINGAVVVAPLPSLSITRSNQTISLSWPVTSSGFVLQESSDSTSSLANWTAVAVKPVAANNQSVVSVPLGSITKFYRLYRP